MKKLFVVIPLVFIFFGCQTFKPYTESKITKFSVPSLNTETTASIGDSLISQGEFESGLAVRITKDCFNGEVPRGVYFCTGYRPIQSENGKSGYVYRFDGSNIRITSMGKTMAAWLEYNTLTKRFGRRLEFLDDIEDYVLENDAKKITDSAFQQTLVYLGKSGSVLKFGYRESFQDLARPSFSNEITYDLNDSDIIGYKKAKLQVISATNTSITYKVLSYFDNSESLF